MRKTLSVLGGVALLTLLSAGQADAGPRPRRSAPVRAPASTEQLVVLGSAGTTSVPLVSEEAPARLGDAGRMRRPVLALEVLVTDPRDAAAVPGPGRQAMAFSALSGNEAADQALRSAKLVDHPRNVQAKPFLLTQQAAEWPELQRVLELKRGDGTTRGRVARAFTALTDDLAKEAVAMKTNAR